MEKNKIFIAPLCLISLFFMLQLVFALTANSSNYSVNNFGNGVIAEKSSSSNYNTNTLTEAKATTRNAEILGYTINIGFFKGTTPHQSVFIDSYSIYPKSSVQNSIVRFGISTSYAQSIWMKLTLPNSTELTIPLSNNVYYYYTPDLIGNYSVIYYANSSTGELAIAIDSFEITAPVAPPSGGGGGSISCKYIWDCDSWSICSPDGKQTRVCINRGTCSGTEAKPIEERNCSESLFDVKFKLGELDLTEGNSLTFNVSLTQTKNTDKIDVQIRYSIINETNTEIFSEVETRAVESSLNYEEILNELRLIPGKYTLRIDITYGNMQKANAQQKFNVVGDGRVNVQNDLSLKIKKPISPLIYPIILVIFLGTLLIFIIKNKRPVDEIDALIKQGRKYLYRGEFDEALDIYPVLKSLYKSKYKGDSYAYEKITSYYEFVSKIVKDKLKKD